MNVVYMNEPNDIPTNILKYSQRKSIYKKNVVLLCHKKIHADLVKDKTKS